MTTQSRSSHSKGEIAQVQLDGLARDGFLLVEQAIDSVTVNELITRFATAFASPQESKGVLESRGIAYASRNPLALIDDVAVLWRRPTLLPLLLTVLGPDFGLVRGLFFDKPPQRSWSLPWHKDESIAVADNQIPSQRFTKRTVKDSVPHVIAPKEVLETMLTLRIHLDEVTNENGPLQVVPGSHLEEDSVANPSPASPVAILAGAGDVLAMRPRLTHASGNSVSGTTRHRRILHLEFAASPTLPDGFEWHRFERGLDAKA
jgi:hypothetical protein